MRLSGDLGSNIEVSRVAFALLQKHGASPLRPPGSAAGRFLGADEMTCSEQDTVRCSRAPSSGEVGMTDLRVGAKAPAWAARLGDCGSASDFVGRRT